MPTANLAEVECTGILPIYIAMRAMLLAQRAHGIHTTIVLLALVDITE